MDIRRDLLRNPWDLIDEMADDELKEEFEIDDILINISLKILNYRINNNLTQKQLSQKLGISQAMVSKLESGEYNPTIIQLWKISKKLGWKFNISLEEEVETQVWNMSEDILVINGEDRDEMIDKLAEGA